MSDNKAIIKILYEVIDAISVLDLDELLQKVDSIVSQITKADSTGIYIIDNHSNSVVLRASKLHFDVVGKLKMKIGEGITGWVAEHGQSVNLLKNAQSDKRFQRREDLPDDLFESFLSVPIKTGDVIIGVINIKHREEHNYSESEVELIEMIGKLVGKAVEHADLLEKTKNLEEALETQKAINRAKTILMDKKGLSENEAYHLIRKKAMSMSKSMKEIANAIITSSEVLE